MKFNSEQRKVVEDLYEELFSGEFDVNIDSHSMRIVGKGSSSIQAIRNQVLNTSLSKEGELEINVFKRGKGYIGKIEEFLKKNDIKYSLGEITDPYVASYKIHSKRSYYPLIISYRNELGLKEYLKDFNKEIKP